MTFAIAAITSLDSAWPGAAWFGAAQFDAAWLTDPWVRWPVTVVYLAVLAVVSVYGLHRYWLVWTYARRRRPPRRPRRFQSLPTVTVQLPMYNEARVARRVIKAACSLDWPRDRLEIQVLDDSTGEAADLVRRCVDDWAQRGVNIHWLHRDGRDGYKAGALAAAFGRAAGRFIAVFDADFIPPPDFLRRVMHHFTDPRVGMVQARWGHLNRDNSLLTRCQAVFLDGHFIIEHTARHRNDRWINFNGTAGVWRREAIESAGGWQHDTLTEDVDLSYRSQSAGWRFVYLPRVICPAELPPNVSAFKGQQHRWAKGSIQAARKLLPDLLRSSAPPGVKVEAFFHLTGPVVYLAVTLMALLFYPALRVNMSPAGGGDIGGMDGAGGTGGAGALIMGLSLLALGAASAGVFYVVSQRAAGRGLTRSIACIPILMSVGVGVAVNNARGVLEALLGFESPFVRTPKYNAAALDDDLPMPASGRAPIGAVAMGVIETSLAVYMLECCRLALLSHGAWLALPFLFLFAMGYAYVGVATLAHCWRSRRRRHPRTPAVAEPS